ncbi:MAG: phosphoadenosine phosphosulfate reductase family protein [Thermodesulfobacteriota bacterium]
MQSHHDTPGAALEHKIAASLDLLRRLAAEHGPRRVAVAWSGGKDSTVALALWRGVLAQVHPGARVLALSLDTRLKFPETLAFRDGLARDWDIDLRVAAPDAAAGLPQPQDKAACCTARKIEPLREAIARLDLAVLVTGLRGDEHASRAGRPVLEPRTGPDHLQANPLLAWTELDVWAYTLDHGLPYCTLYDQGYASLGCQPCTLRPDDGERSGRHPDKEALLEQLHSLGYF